MNIFELCLLLLNTPYLLIEKITCENGRLQLAVESTRLAATCPACTQQSQALHSTYRRYPQDLPWGTLPVVLQLKVKRFFCHNPSCPKQTFAERFPDLVDWYARRTQRVIGRQERLTTSTTARTAERLLKDEQIHLSDTTINRLIRGLPDPERQPVRVLGVDDWAKCKGQRYGAILIDLEQSEVIDLLPDRTADTLTEWLKCKPEIEIVSRDRSQTYAQAIHSGAPNAIQVADRFHLLQNLSDTVYQLLQKEEKTIHQHFAVILPQQDLPEPQPPDRSRPLRPEDRAEEAETILAELSEGQPRLTETIELARAFADMVRQQQADQLGGAVQKVLLDSPEPANMDILLW